jgi:hypothetical protein
LVLHCQLFGTYPQVCKRVFHGLTYLTWLNRGFVKKIVQKG